MKNLRISKKFLAIVMTVCSLSVLSCKDELSNLDSPPNGGGVSLINVSVEQQDVARIQFAKILAKALENKEVRDFVKKESLKMFDNDFDVLYHANKNKLVNGTDSFSSILSKSNDLKAGELDKIVNILPKLNILVPDFFTKSAKTWDIETDIPLVAVSNSELENKKVDFVRAYDAKANETKLDAHKFPDRVMVVVKNNERIEALNVVKNGRSAIEKEWIPYFKEGDVEFFIAGQGFVNEKFKKSNQKVASIPKYGLNLEDYQDAVTRDGGWGTVFCNIWESIPEIFLTTFYNNSGQPSWIQAMQRGSHRKSIYYKKDGSLNQNVKERMAYCRFSNFGGLEAINESWTDGNLDLFCEVGMLKVRPGDDFDQFTLTKSLPLGYAMVGAYGGNNNTTINAGGQSYNLAQYKQQGLDYDILTEFTTNGTDQYSKVPGVWINWFGEGVTWSPFLYGETMRYVFYEKDDGAEKTDTYSTSTTLSANFGVGLKDVWNVGGTSSSTNTRTLSVKSTNTSDPLGTYLLDYGQDLGFARYPITLGNFQFITQTK